MEDEAQDTKRKEKTRGIGQPSTREKKRGRTDKETYCDKGRVQRRKLAA